MPRARKRQRRRIAGQVASHEELGDALGVHRNTIGAWARKGAPAGPPYSVLEWYTWARAKGYGVSKPRDDDQRALVDAGGGQEFSADEHELPGTTPYDPLLRTGRISLEAARQREQLKGDMLVVEQRQIAVAQAQVEHDKAKGALIPKDDSSRAAMLVFNSFVTEGEQLAESVIQALAQYQHSQKAEISAAVKAAWSGVLERVGKVSDGRRG